MNNYIGHENQVAGVEEYKLVGGKGDGMRMLNVRNGKGLDLSISIDRCLDISRLTFKGDNMGYFSPNGYVSPQYYDDKGAGFLKSFTAGFLTTCGLNSVGTPSNDMGEDLGLHGTISHIPAENVYHTRNDKEIVIHGKVCDEGIFSHKFVMNRTIAISIITNEILISDEIENRGDDEYPIMILYHLNMGYPLLSENSEIKINSSDIIPRNKHSKKGLDSWNKTQKPTPNYEEECFFHSFDNEGKAEIFNPDIKKGLEILFDTEELPFFTQWKMMGHRDYVMGLEPGNCLPDGRDVARKNETLKILKPNEKVNFNVRIRMFEN